MSKNRVNIVFKTLEAKFFRLDALPVWILLYLGTLLSLAASSMRLDVNAIPENFQN